MTTSSTGSVRSVRFWWRISRYDPARRDSRGAYQDDTWTSITDVGSVLKGYELTISDYQAVETAYVETFVVFAEDCDVTTLEIRCLESGEGLEERARIDVGETADVVRRMLREEVICKLESPVDDFALHVGFGLYTYVGSARRSARAVERARELGLFVDEDWPSQQVG